MYAYQKQQGKGGGVTERGAQFSKQFPGSTQLTTEQACFSCFFDKPAAGVRVRGIRGSESAKLNTRFPIPDNFSQPTDGTGRGQQTTTTNLEKINHTPVVLHRRPPNEKSLGGNAAGVFLFPSLVQRGKTHLPAKKRRAQPNKNRRRSSRLTCTYAKPFAFTSFH